MEQSDKSDRKTRKFTRINSIKDKLIDLIHVRVY
jgi:hypothetical protein